MVQRLDRLIGGFWRSRDRLLHVTHYTLAITEHATFDEPVKSGLNLSS